MDWNVSIHFNPPLLTGCRFCSQQPARYPAEWKPSFLHRNFFSNIYWKFHLVFNDVYWGLGIGWIHCSHIQPILWCHHVKKIEHKIKIKCGSKFNICYLVSWTLATTSMHSQTERRSESGTPYFERCRISSENISGGSEYSF